MYKKKKIFRLLNTTLVIAPDLSNTMMIWRLDNSL